jgi:hypothetical protein
MGPVIAIWCGPWGYKLPDGTDLIPGESRREIPEAQANDDPNWQVVGAKTSTEDDD